MRWPIVLATVLATLASCRLALESDMTYQPVQKIDGGSGCVKGTSGVCQCVVETNDACMGAVGQSTFTYINTEILNDNCQGSSCHQTDSSSDAKKNPYADAATSYASLVNFQSNVTPGQVLVVPSQPTQSYALVMLNYIPAEKFDPPTVAYPSKDIGLMPQSNPSLCCQKLDAINAWIEAGALNN